MIKRPVDFFGSSAYISDNMFWKQLELFLSFKEYRWSKAQIQIGIHGVKGFVETNRISSLEEWETYYDKLVMCIMNVVPDLTIALTTPIIKTNNSSTPYQYWDDEITKRNKIAAKIAEKYKLNINDLYTLMIDETHRDAVHFTKEGSEKIAKTVAQSLKLL